MKRIGIYAVLAGLLGVAVAAGIAGAADDNKCTIATTGDSEVAKACKASGRQAARKVMKGMLERPAVRATRLKCGSCHADMETFELRKNGRQDFARIEALLKR